MARLVLDGATWRPFKSLIRNRLTSCLIGCSRVSEKSRLGSVILICSVESCLSRDFVFFNAIVCNHLRVPVFDTRLVTR